MNVNFVKTDSGYVNLDLVTLVVVTGDGRCRLLGGDDGSAEIDDAKLDAVLKRIDNEAYRERRTAGDAGRP
jgi:hypothetical protein